MKLENLQPAAARIFNDGKALLRYVHCVPALRRRMPPSGCSADRILVERIPGGATNTVVRLSCGERGSGAKGVSIIAKLYTAQYMMGDTAAPGVSRDWGRVEFETIRRIAALDDVGVAEPYYFDHELNVLFMKDCAPEGTRRLSESPASLDPQCRIPEGMGTWLRRLHDDAQMADELQGRERREIRRFTLDYQIACARRLIRRRPAAKGRLGIILRESVETPESSRALLHGNLCPKNVLVHEGGGLTLLDFEASAPGDPAYDGGYFLAHYLIEWMRGGCEEEYATLAWNRFLESYGWRSSGPDFLKRLLGWSGLTLLYRGAHPSDAAQRPDEELYGNLISTGTGLLSDRIPPPAEGGLPAAAVIREIRRMAAPLRKRHRRSFPSFRRTT